MKFIIPISNILLTVQSIEHRLYNYVDFNKNLAIFSHECPEWPKKKGKNCTAPSSHFVIESCKDKFDVKFKRHITSS